MSKLIEKIWFSSPSQIFKALKRRVLRESSWHYSIEAIASSKHMNFCTLIDRWERYSRVIETNSEIPTSDYEFFGKTIFELGCGPLFGWSPIAIFLGAKKYYYFEPNISMETVNSLEIKQKYFLPLYNELVSNYGPRMRFENFYNKVIQNTESIDFNSKDIIDLTISNSVLEHIPRSELRNTLMSLHSISKEKSTFMHVVDFGDHNNRSINKLDNIYIKNCNKETAQLNLLRISDIEEMLKEVKFRSINKIIYRSSEINMDKIDESWSKYSEDELRSRVVFFIGST